MSTFRSDQGRPAIERRSQADAYTDQQSVVVDGEREYLEAHRRAHGLQSLEQDPDLWGLCLSGGGIRSSTFSLGVLQALIRNKKLSRFDYLSTVSGGGYIGSCLSSMLSECDETGVDPENSPFVGLRHDEEDNQPPEKTQLSVRHQLHHLRTHGQYLTPRSHFFSRDVQRAVGTVIAGTVHHLFLFVLIMIALVAGCHALLSLTDEDLSTLAPKSVVVSTPSWWDYVYELSVDWYEGHFVGPVSRTLGGWDRTSWRSMGISALIGSCWTFGWLVFAFWLRNRIVQQHGMPSEDTRSGWTHEDQMESRFVIWFNLSSVSLAVAVAMVLTFIATEFVGFFNAGVWLPLGFAVGGLVVTLPFVNIIYSLFLMWRRLSRQRSGLETCRVRRSLISDIQGACAYGTLFSIVAPIFYIFVMSLAVIPFRYLGVLLAFGVGAYCAQRKTGLMPGLSIPGGWMQRPLADAAVLVLVCLLAAFISEELLEFYQVSDWPMLAGGGIISLEAFLIAVAFGALIDSNRISPHYFYRDRLSEAFLCTYAQTTRKKGSRHQGLPLRILRNSEHMLISDLGGENKRGPYHLIVTSLNLTGSDELNRRGFLSDHFVFSRDYVGSQTTGWMNTNAYDNGTTTLARVMTISAAAASSSVGPHTFGAQAFMATLLNIRLGYWMPNPWWYSQKPRFMERAYMTFWPFYLGLEILRQTSARHHLVNLSDGGHTGDNLGLMPLLIRRCSTILVVDCEADPKYSFTSFNNAVRMAYIELDAKIDIDLTPIICRDKAASGIALNQQSVARGKITYRDGRSGTLIYLKASVSEIGEDTQEAEETAAVGSSIPVHVANYMRDHPAFPQQTTLDQYFDDAQFEAYRALGAYIGKKAVRVLSDPAEPRPKPVKRERRRREHISRPVIRA